MILVFILITILVSHRFRCNWANSIKTTSFSTHSSFTVLSILYVYSFDFLFIKLQIFFCSFFLCHFIFFFLHCCRCCYCHSLFPSFFFPKIDIHKHAENITKWYFFGIGWYPKSFIVQFIVCSDDRSSCVRLQ